ncbi:MAG: carboxylate--amine ligase, partial [Pseudonocardiaceae bacterium]
ELARTWHACAGTGRADGTALMLQEYIPEGRDYFFHGYSDASAQCRPAFIGIKERSYPAHAGLTSLGRWVDHPELHRQATELVARLGFRGIVDLDYRFDPRDATFKLLDFNPRLGAQFRLFRDTAGIDVVVAAHLNLTGRAIPPGSPRLGRSLLVENYDPIAALAYRHSGLDLRSWVSSVRRADELAWFARDDLAPFGLMCLRMGWRALTRPLARHRSALLPTTTRLAARRAPA